MPGDMSASATTFSTVVREGPWMCSAEMQASIRRCRWRAREARSGTAVALLEPWAPGPSGRALATAATLALTRGALLAFLRFLAMFTSRPQSSRARCHGQKLNTAPILSRKIVRRHPSGGNHENARTAGPLAHHSPAAAVPHGLLSDSLRVRFQDQPGRDGTPGTALHGHL